MVGKVILAYFKALENMPQKYQSAWDGVEWEKFTGAKYKPILCAGEQLVHGMKYYYVAEQTFSDEEGTRHLVRLSITEIDGEYLLNVKDFLEIL